MLSDELSSAFYLAKITDDSAAPNYQYQEVWDDGTGALVVKEGGRYGGASNPGVDVLGVTFAVDDIVLVRSADGAGGLTAELLPFALVGDIPAYDIFHTFAALSSQTASTQVLTVPRGEYLFIAQLNVNFAGTDAITKWGIGACDAAATPPSSPKLPTARARQDGKAGDFEIVTLAQIFFPGDLDDTGATANIDVRVYKEQTSGSGTIFDVEQFLAIRLDGVPGGTAGPKGDTGDTGPAGADGADASPDDATFLIGTQVFGA